MRHAYICPHCDQRSTRWWNLKTHIKRRHGSLLPDRSSDRYMGSNPLWHTPNNPHQSLVTDSVGDSLLPGYIPQQAPLGLSQYSSRPIDRPMPTMDDQSYRTGFSQGTKLEELKRLVYRNAQIHNNSPDEIVRYAAYWSINGDDTFLDNSYIA